MKGLDHSLLAQTRAKQDSELVQQAEDELDSLLPALPSASSSTLPEASTASDSKIGTKKRTRQDRIDELKAKLGQPKEVKPIDEEDAFRSKFRKVGQKEVPVVLGKDGKVKKLRKKKKLVAASEVQTPVVEQSIPEPTPTVTESIPTPVEAVEVPQPIDDIDSDVDIFANAAEYGASSSSDSEDGQSKPSTSTLPVPSTSTTAKSNWFDDNSEITADPISAPTLPKRPKIAVVEEDSATSRRLQGFHSNDGIDVKSLLEMDKLAEKEEKRKERKAKYAKPVAEGGEAVEGAGRKKKKLTDVSCSCLFRSRARC